MIEGISEIDLKEIVARPQYRKEFRKSFFGFRMTYLPHHFFQASADFHPELNNLLQDWSIDLLGVVGFRGSAKSTFASLALPLYAVLELDIKFVVLIFDTEEMMKLGIANIRNELEKNELIQLDYGDLIVTDTKKGTKFSEINILLANGARIIGRTRGQRIRGLKHRQYRPQLIIGDDLEDLEKVDSKRYRDKTERWLRSTVIPSIEEFGGRLIIIGNLLHADGLMNRLKKDKIFTFRAYPLIKKGEDWEQCTWKAKFKNQAMLMRQKAKVKSLEVWMREYLLKVIPPDGQDVKEDWIRYYDEVPEDVVILQSVIGLDPAISKDKKADFTTMIPVIGTRPEGKPKIYVLPNIVNEHYTLHETITKMKVMKAWMQDSYSMPTFYIEDVAYQKALIQEANRKLLPTKAVKPGADKRARLATVASYIQDGTVVFPRTGAEELIQQLVGFGVEEHDDLVDAFVYAIFAIMQRGLKSSKAIRLV